MLHLREREKKNNRNKKTAFENMKVNRRSNNVSSTGKRKKLFEPSQIRYGSLRKTSPQRQNIDKGKERRRIKMHRVVRNWKVILEDTVKAVQEMALRGEEHQSCKASAIAFNYNGGCVHTFPEERPTQRFWFSAHTFLGERQAVKTPQRIILRNKLKLSSLQRCVIRKINHITLSNYYCKNKKYYYIHPTCM